MEDSGSVPSADVRTGRPLEVVGRGGVAVPTPVDRLATVDFLRGVAMATVVAHHLSWRLLLPPHLAQPGGSLLAATYLASDFGVSLFVAVSTLTLVWRYGQAFAGLGDYARLLSKRARQLLPAYILWSLASLFARDPSLLESPRGVAEALLFGTADVQLYYVPMLFQLFLLWPVLRPLVVRHSAAGALGVFVLGAAISELTRRGVIVPVWTPLLFLSTAVAIGAGLKFLLPGVSGHALPRTTVGRGWLCAVLAVAAGVLLHVSVDTFLDGAVHAASRPDLYWYAMSVAREEAAYNVCVIAALALAAPTLSRLPLGRMLAALGRASYGVFLLHLLLASTFLYKPLATDSLGSQSLPAAAMGFAGLWLLTLVLSYGATRLLMAQPLLAWTVGANRPRPASRP